MKSTPIFNKTDQFIEIYLRSGNATEAAWRVYSCKTRESAQSLGSQILRKNKVLVSMLMEQRDITIGKLIDIAWEKCQKNSKPDFWDRLMKIGGYDTYR